MRFGSVLHIARANAILAWILLAGLSVSVAGNFVGDELLWALFGTATILIALVPPLLAKNPTVMVSWKVLLLSVLPALTHVLNVFIPLLGYVSIAALGLLIVSEIDQFTSARLPNWLAAALVVMATMTVASFWVSVRFFSNLWLGTSFVTSVEALMWGLIAATAIGVGFGILFGGWLRSEEARAR